MIGRLRGTVLPDSGPSLLVDVGGVGYEITPSSALRSALAPGETADVVIFTDVREDSIRLYGFLDQLERQVFELLLRVSGIGPRTAMEIVSGLPARDLMRALGEGDVQRLVGIKGVGRKTAERIIVELRDKVGSAALDLSTPSSPVKRGPFDDAVEALRALGFPHRDAERAVKEVERAMPPAGGAAPEAGEIVREALRHI